MITNVEVPKQMQGRPKYGGYIVPYFVAWYLDDKPVNEKVPGAVPSFVTIDIQRATFCRTNNLCWCCGKQLGAHKWFVFGPASAIAQTSVEPPSHAECAHYAVQVCPFILDPDRNMRGPTVPTKLGQAVNPGVSVHNPGVSVLWATKKFEAFKVGRERGVYWYAVGEPEVVEFWRKGKKATRAEVVEAVDASLKVNGYDKADREVAWRIEKVMRFAPEEA